jgi:hypothetical protein
MKRTIVVLIIALVALTAISLRYVEFTGNAVLSPPTSVHLFRGTVKCANDKSLKDGIKIETNTTNGINYTVTTTYSSGGKYQIYVGGFSDGDNITFYINGKESGTSVFYAFVNETVKNLVTSDTSLCDPGTPTSCFPAGTKILMSDNSYKSIEDIKIGDSIMSYDQLTKSKISAKVLELESPIRNHLCKITFSDKNELLVTNEHPIFTNNSFLSLNVILHK